MKIAIVGAGVAGSSVLRALVNQDSEGRIQHIDVYEFRTELSRGLPYQEDDQSLLMNTPAERISVYLDQPLDFKKWLKENNKEDNDIQDLVLRRDYGQYLNERFAPYFDLDRVRVIHDRVVDFQVLDQEGQFAFSQADKPTSYRVKTKKGGGWSDRYDAVYFTVGHPPYADYYDLTGAEHFIRNPYPVKNHLSQLDDQQKIGIIGSAGTSFDILRYLIDYYEFNQPISFYIRTTPFTPTKSLTDEEPFISTIDDQWIEDHRDPMTGLLHLEDIIDQVREDFDRYSISWDWLVEQHGVGDLSENIRQFEQQPRDLAVVQDYIIRLTPYLPDLYQYMGQKDRLYYNRVYRPNVDHFRLVVPYETMGFLLDQIKEGRLRIVPGLTDIKEKEAGDFDIYLDKHLHESCDVIINATGFELRLEEASKSDPLIHQLYNKRYIMPAETDGKGVAVSWPDAQVLSERYGYLPYVYFLGHYIHPTQYGNNNAQLNMKQGRRSAEHLLNNFKG